MKLLRFMLCIPIVNVFLFAFMPYTAYREFFLAYIEAHGKTLQEVWDNSNEREREILSQYNLYGDRNIKREGCDTTSAISSEGHQEGADISGISKTE